MASFTIRTTIWILLFLAIQTPAFAQWHFAAQPQISYISYKETLPSHLKSEERGALPGIGAQLSHYGSNFRWISDINIHAGSMLYDGATQNGNPIQAQKHNQFTTIESVIQTGPTRLGIGVEIWDRDLISYHETYSRQYAIVGVSFPAVSNGDLRAHVDIKAAIPFHSSMNLAMNLNSQDHNLQFPLENQIGWKISTPISVGGHSNTIQIIPYIEISSFGASEIVQISHEGDTLNIYEPSSQTFKSGLVFSVNI